MDNTLLIIIVVIIAVVAYLLFRRRGASRAASSTTNAVKDTASGAASMTKDAASSAASMTAGSAAGAASMTKDAASSAASMTASMTKDAAVGAGGAMAGAAEAKATTAGSMDLGQMTNVLGGIMNGNMQPDANSPLGQMSDMLGGIMNGNLQLDANSPLGKMVMPMADNITTKLGLPKEVGAMVVTFALAKLAEMMKAKKAGTGNAPMPGGMNADEVLGKINSGDGIDAGSLKSMGLTSELAKKVNVTEDQASQGLEMAIGELSAGLSGKTSYQGMNLPDMSMLKDMMK